MSRAILRLMQGLDPTEPTKEALQEVICKVFSHLRLRDAERLFLLLAFNISFDGHNLAPRRASGEIYFLHVFRQFIYAAFLMSRHQVLSVKMLAAILLHDTVEDATKAGSTRLLAKTTIHLILQDEDVEYMVMCLTKKASPKEERRAYLKRVLSVDVWEVLVAKPFDANDNILTLSVMSKEKQLEKIREVKEFYPRLEKRALGLIEKLGQDGSLPMYKNWMRLVGQLHLTLQRNARLQEERYKKEFASL